MSPFEFIILFLSFIYTLALTHLLFAWTRMIRHRDRLTLSWPHLLWMLLAFVTLAGNWLSLWDFRRLGDLSLGAISFEFLFVILNYFLCALVSPDFDDGETYDLKQFHESQRPTYVLVFLLLVLVAIAQNFAAGSGLGLTKEGEENALVIFYVPLILLPLVLRSQLVQVAAPVALLAASISYLVLFYPALTG